MDELLKIYTPSDATYDVSFHPFTGDQTTSISIPEHHQYRLNEPHPFSRTHISRYPNCIKIMNRGDTNFVTLVFQRPPYAPPFKLSLDWLGPSRRSDGVQALPRAPENNAHVAQPTTVSVGHPVNEERFLPTAEADRGRDEKEREDMVTDSESDMEEEGGNEVPDTDPITADDDYSGTEDSEDDDGEGSVAEATPPPHLGLCSAGCQNLQTLCATCAINLRKYFEWQKYRRLEHDARALERELRDSSTF